MTENLSNPYVGLPSKAFWRTGAAMTRPNEAADIYEPAFRLDRNCRIATAGSCFAQHIARTLRDQGYPIVDVEPAPDGTSDETKARFGYGIYSARYGNIYVARQLLQLFDEVHNRRTPAEIVWEKDGRFYDALRPNVEPEGLASPEEVLASRASHLIAVHRMVKQTDVFVFTLGLTEAWVSKEDGTVYPSAPGVIAGTFDPDKYELHNFKYPEIYRDLDQFIRRIRHRAPDMRFILTVSPVPLTATATGKHVVQASTYSKSVLRAVAGDIADAVDGVDYFPSYELIATHWSKGQYFEENLRSVSKQGVATAMKTFMEQHDPGESTPEPPSNPRSDLRDASEEDVVCEDALLEAFSK